MASSPRLAFFWPKEKQERWSEALRRAGADNVRFHINGDVLETLSYLLEADIVMGGPSSYPSLAHMYSLGVLLHATKDGEEGPTDTVKPCRSTGGSIGVLAPLCSARTRNRSCANAMIKVPGEVGYAPRYDVDADSGECAIELLGCHATPPVPLAVASDLDCKLRRLVRFKNLLRLASTALARTSTGTNDTPIDNTAPSSSGSEEQSSSAVGTGQWLSLWSLIAGAHPQRLVSMLNRSDAHNRGSCPEHFARSVLTPWLNRNANA